jgi:NAD(P)H dehydrogenase (quinone)
MSTILIAGASGAVGIPTIRHLVKRGQRIRALTSSEASSRRLLALGVAETVIGDFRKDSDVRRAVAGADIVFQIPPRFTEDEAAIGLRIVDAARAGGVGAYVFSSAFHPQMRKMDHHWAKLLVEEAVIESGLSYAILQPAMFMQNIRIEWPAIRDRGVYPRPYSPARKLRLVDTEDVGEAAAIVLTEPRFWGGTYELCGPDALSHAEMAAALAASWGRPVRAEKRDPDEWAIWAKAHGWSAWSIAAYRKMCAHYDAHGYPGGNPVVLSAILGRAPGGFAAFIDRFVAEQKAAS